MFSVCPHLWGGDPYPIMLCNISQNAMRQPAGGVPLSHNALQHFPECHGAATGGGGGEVSCQVQSYKGGTLPGPAEGGYPAGGYPGQVPPQPGQLGGYPAGVGTQVR